MLRHRPLRPAQAQRARLVDVDVDVERVDRDDGRERRGRGGADQVAGRDEDTPDAPRDRRAHEGVIEVELCSRRRPRRPRGAQPASKLETYRGRSRARRSRWQPTAARRGARCAGRVRDRREDCRYSGSRAAALRGTAVRRSRTVARPCARGRPRETRSSSSSQKRARESRLFRRLRRGPCDQ